MDEFVKLRNAIITRVKQLRTSISQLQTTISNQIASISQTLTQKADSEALTNLQLGVSMELSKKADATKLSELQGDIAKQPTFGGSPKVGQIFRVAAIGEDGKLTMQPVDMVSDGIKTVSVAGTALTPDNGVVNVPYMTPQIPGVAKYYDGGGIAMQSSGQMYAVSYGLPTYKTRGDNAFISKGTLQNARQDIIRRSLLSNTQITDADKPLICQTIGAQTREGIQLIRRVTLEEPAENIQINTTSDGQPFNALDFCVLVSIPKITGTKSYLNAQWRSVRKGYYQNFPTAYALDPTRDIQALYAMEYFANRMIPRLFFGRPRGTCENPSAFGILDEISPINGVWFSQYNTSSSLIPAGTTFELYGRLV